MHEKSELLHHSPYLVRLAGRHSGFADFPPHDHEFWEVIYQWYGHVKTFQANDAYSVTPGAILTIPPRTMHADIFLGYYEIIYVHMECPAPRRWPRICHDTPEHSIGRIVQAIYREFHQRETGRDEMLALLAHELACMLDRAHDAQITTPGEAIVAEAELLLEQRSNDPIAIDDIATQVGISRSVLYDLFKRLRGRAPMDVVNEARLRNTLSLLRHTNMTLEAIAAECGYSSASHLSRRIKAATGVTPGQLRDRMHCPPVKQSDKAVLLGPIVPV